MVVSINGVTVLPQNWLVFFGKSIYKWMIWGYPYFRKPPYIYIIIYILSYIYNCTIIIPINLLLKCICLAKLVLVWGSPSSSS